jgi:hypothetical protein
MEVIKNEARADWVLAQEGNVHRLRALEKWGKCWLIVAIAGCGLGSFPPEGLEVPLVERCPRGSISATISLCICVNKGAVTRVTIVSRLVLAMIKSWFVVPSL